MSMTPTRAFLLCLLIGAIAVPALAWLDRAPARRTTFNAVEGGVPAHGVALAAGVTVKDQIARDAISAIQRAGVRTIIALRPDGEERGQVSSLDIAAAAQRAGMQFAYVPTPVNEIPDAVVDQLTKALAGAERPVLLYCGSGWRAARVWALAEASRDGGGDAVAIMAAVRAARHDIDDLKPRIEARIANRRGAM